MQVKAEQLASRLSDNTLPMIWICGDDPLLVQEACDAVRLHAREQGFGEREILEAGKGFDWNALLSAGNDLSLFAERKLIDLRLILPKPDDVARKALQQYLENPNPDNLLLLSTPRIDKASQNTKWFKALEAKALFCQIWPVSEQQLPNWISNRIKQAGMTADHDAVQILADKVEGNLLAAAQEIEKLRIVHQDDKITAAMVLDAVSDSSRFNIFALTDACLAGNSERALKILQHLQAEGEESLFLVAMLSREIRNLSAMLSDINEGHNMHGVLQSHRVWSNRTQIVTRSLQHHSQGSLLKLLEKSRRVDQAVKGLSDIRPWDELSSLVLGFSNPRLLISMV